MIGIFIYLMLGVAACVVENKHLEYGEHTDHNATTKFLTFAQLFLHDLRFVLTWPLYILEDFILWVYNREIDLEDGDDNDDGL